MSNHLRQQDEENEEQEFYESLDRIVSSSCSSTSCSDDDGDPCPRRIPRFPPPAATSYDLWISEPSSIEDRRRRFLRHMGLFGDPALSRQKSTLRSRSNTDRIQNVEVMRSVNRSRSDSVVDLRSDGDRSGKGEGDLDRRCTIKNLDNGEEFVVREDGMWNRMRDLTIEEFELCVGRSPIVQELMRRQNVEDSCSNGFFCNQNGGFCSQSGGFNSQNGGLRSGPCKKKGGWLKSIKHIAGNVVAGGYYRERRNNVSTDLKDLSSEKGSRRLSSGTDDSQDGGSHCGLERVRVRQYGKSFKEFTGVYMTQEIHAHNGSIWCIKFSLEGKYLASAGEDCVIHVWQVSENRGRNESSESDLALTCAEGSHWERKRKARLSNGRKSASSDHLVVPDQLFSLGENPACSFKGHLDDVLDLSWSKSEYLLSSSMDKTVRLWHMSSVSCLKVFSHTDYVTSIQFNPVDDRYFISGSLDQKVRIWSIPDRQIVDWNDLHEMVTATCYTPDGQGALVGSHKGSCHLYDTSDNKLHLRSQIDLQNNIKKSSHKKITGFQFVPGRLSEVLITSADSRIRVVDGTEIVHKFKGFRNTSSQISASLSTNGKYVVSASEDSHVYIWRYDSDAQPNRSRGGSVASTTQSYEHFHCRDVTVAIPWQKSTGSRAVSRCSSQQSSIGDRATSTWPEEKLTPRNSVDFGNERLQLQLQSRSAWGMVIVTAGRSGKIRTFQNFAFSF